MDESAIPGDAGTLLERAGLPAETATAWLAGHPSLGGNFAADAEEFSQFWQRGAALLAKLPKTPGRNADQRAAGALIRRVDRDARERFLDRHAETLYRRLTDDLRRFVRIEDLVYDAASHLPGIAPTREAVAQESALPLSEKEGVEIDQGIFLSRVLAQPAAGQHLCHAMLLPRRETAERLPEFIARGAIDLGAASVQRIGKACLVQMRHPRFLNAEDDTTIDAIETAVDLAILDPGTEVAVLRGDTVEHAKYRGGRVFSAGINLTHLYLGKIPYVWYLKRDMGVVNKIFRGLSRQDASPDDTVGQTVEKPWIAAVDAFAIGGGCQYLLVMDYVVAARDAYLTLPARKEGIMRRGRRAGGDGRGDRRGRRRLHQFRDGQRRKQPPGLSRRPGTARRLSRLYGGLRARAGLLPFQPGADRQSRAPLERAVARDIAAGAWRRQALKGAGAHCSVASRSPPFAASGSLRRLGTG